MRHRGAIRHVAALSALIVYVFVRDEPVDLEVRALRWAATILGYKTVTET